MLPLPFLLPLLPKYDSNNAYGKKGDIKAIVKFKYPSSPIWHTYKDLTTELIYKTVVTSIIPTATGYMGHTSSGLLIYCEERSDDNA